MPTQVRLLTEQTFPRPVWRWHVFGDPRISDAGMRTSRSSRRPRRRHRPRSPSYRRSHRPRPPGVARPTTAGDPALGPKFGAVTFAPRSTTRPTAPSRTPRPHKEKRASGKNHQPFPSQGRPHERSRSLRLSSAGTASSPRSNPSRRSRRRRSRSRRRSCPHWPPAPRHPSAPASRPSG